MKSLPERYSPPPYLFNGHLQTIVPFFTEKPDNKLYETTILELSDGDFLELDRIAGNTSNLIIICHGLEGNSRSHYVQQTARHFRNLRWHVLAWNFRSCGRKPNRLPKTYHPSSTEDLESVLDHEILSRKFKRILLVGFSIGASLCLNLNFNKYKDKINAIVCFSVPLDFRETSDRLHSKALWIYHTKFLEKLMKKAQKMAKLYPDTFKEIDLSAINSIEKFIEKVTVLLHGFDNLNAFYEASNTIKNLENLEIPTLIVNAQNDPLLGPNSYPKNVNNKYLELHYPLQGGHSAFPIQGGSWIPFKIINFIDRIINSRFIVR